MTLCSQPPLPGAPTSIHPARGTVACFEHLIGICLGNLSPALFIFETVCLRLTLNFLTVGIPGVPPHPAPSSVTRRLGRRGASRLYILS